MSSRDPIKNIVQIFNEKQIYATRFVYVEGGNKRVPISKLGLEYEGPQKSGDLLFVIDL